MYVIYDRKHFEKYFLAINSMVWLHGYVNLNLGNDIELLNLIVIWQLKCINGPH